MAPRIVARFWLWLAALAALAAVFLLIVQPRLTIETDLLDLLPRDRAEGTLADRLASFAGTGARRLLFLVGHRSTEIASAASTGFADSLAASGAFADVHAHWAAQMDSASALYRENRFVLLARSIQASLEANRPEEVEQGALATLYSPIAFARPGGSDDPLGLDASFLLEEVPSAGAAQLEGDQLVVREGDTTYVLIVAQLQGSPFDSGVQQQASAAIGAATAAAQSAAGGDGGAIRVLVSGALPHATAATRSATREVALLSTIGTVAVLALLVSLFRSWRAPALGMVALAAGGSAGIAATYFIFGRVHLIALVFGSSLIGVAIDYSMHYLSDQFRGPHWTPESALRHVAPPILMSMGATLAGFAGLLLMPFPGLRQMAVIALAGLPVACATVLLVFPVLAETRPARLPAWCGRFLIALDGWSAGARRSRYFLRLIVPLLLVAALGLVRIQFQDDIRALQPPANDAVTMERRTRELLKDSTETAVFLVSARDAQELLRSEERLTAELARMVEGGRLGSFRAVTQSLPSEARQRAAFDLLHRYVYSRDGVLARVMRKIGYDERAIAAELATFPPSPHFLEPATWLAHPASELWRPFWLGESGGTFATVVTLGGAGDLAELRSVGARLPGVRFVDRVHDISQTLMRYRVAVSWLLAGIYFVLATVLAFAFGLKAALRLMLPPVGAILIALGGLGWLGIPVTLFTVLALLLTLAMAVDYAIFLHEARNERRTALLAVTLSALTTALSFGLLAFSTTPFIRAIGLTLAMGLGACWLLAVASAEAPDSDPPSPESIA
ncbi:MAG TPA: MMPL family transporter [Steroidobacteraceae bacterium]|nr:MMPL family transporter [Steroidobacteraceae bacterium]